MIFPRKYTWQFQRDRTLIELSPPKLDRHIENEFFRLCTFLGLFVFVLPALFFQPLNDQLMRYVGLPGGIASGVLFYVWKTSHRMTIEFLPAYVVVTHVNLKWLKRSRRYPWHVFNSLGFKETRIRRFRTLFTRLKEGGPESGLLSPHQTLFLMRNNECFLPLMSLPNSKYSPHQIERIFSILATKMQRLQFVGDLSRKRL